MPAHWAGTACPPDSCLCHPRVGTAQRSPDLCLPVPPCPLPSWSEGQLFLGSAPDVSPQIPSRLALTWDSRPRTSWSPPAADAMGVVATGRAAPGQRPAPECFPKSFLGPVWPPHRPAALSTLPSCGQERPHPDGRPGPSSHWLLVTKAISQMRKPRLKEMERPAQRPEPEPHWADPEPELSLPRLSAPPALCPTPGTWFHWAHRAGVPRGSSGQAALPLWPAATFPRCSVWEVGPFTQGPRAQS